MRIPTAAAAAFVMAALASFAAPPAFGQAIPDSLKQAGNTEACDQGEGEMPGPSAWPAA